MSAEQIRPALLVWVGDPRQQDAGCISPMAMGALRLAMAMLGRRSNRSSRPAIADDEALLLRWANDPQVRASSFSPDLMARSDHHNWFRQGLADPNRLLLIATAADGCAIGQIRFDRQPLHKADASEARDLTLDRCARGHGLSADLVRLGLQVMEQTWGPGLISPVWLRCSSINAASNACFTRAGFVQETISPVALPVSFCESLALPPSRITLLSDRGSWLNRYLPNLIYALWQRGMLCGGFPPFTAGSGRCVSVVELRPSK